MEDKQNTTINPFLYYNRPAHQGRIFRLDLGLNHGPFLPKDIMHSNQRSTCLIAAKQVLQCHQSMTSLMSHLTKEVQKQERTLKNEYAAGNWFAQCENFEESVRDFEMQIKKLKSESDRLKTEIKNSYVRLTNENTELAQNFAPLLRNLLNTVRDQNREQKHIFEEQKRDMEDLGNFRNSYLDELVKCEQKILNTEYFLGVDQADEPSESI